MDYPAFKGFRNPTASSCFIDSLLVAMFGPFIVHRDENANATSKALFGGPLGPSRTQNFWSVMLEQNIEERITPFNYVPVCNVDVEADMALRGKIQATLREDVRNLMRGERRECSRLRRLIGTICRLPGYIDLARGYQDPTEVYNHLMNIFAYHPLWFHTTEAFAYKLADDQAQTICTRLDEFTHQMHGSNFVTVKMDDLAVSHRPGERSSSSIHLEWAWNPDSWEPVDYEEGTNIECNGEIIQPPPNLKFIRQYFDQVDVFTVYVNRGDPASRTFERRLRVPNTLTFNPLDKQGYTMEQLAQMRGNEALPLNAFERGEQQYRLLSAIIHSGQSKDGAHYTTLIRVPVSAARYREDLDTWYLYDDLRSIPYRELSNADARKMLATRSVMLFYYPFNEAPPAVVKKKEQVDDEKSRKKLKTELEKRRSLEGRGDGPATDYEQFLFPPFGEIGGGGPLVLEPMESFQRRIDAIVNRLTQMSFDPIESRHVAIDVVQTVPEQSVAEDVALALSRLL